MTADLRAAFTAWAAALAAAAEAITRLFRPLSCRCPNGDTYRVGPTTGDTCTLHDGIRERMWNPNP